MYALALLLELFIAKKMILVSSTYFPFHVLKTRVDVGRYSFIINRNILMYKGVLLTGTNVGIHFAIKYSYVTI